MKSKETTLAILRTAIRLREHNLALAAPLTGVIRKADAKRGRLANRIERNKHSRSMMVAQHPKGMLPVPRFNDERTKTLFDSYSRRLAVKADRQ